MPGFFHFLARPLGDVVQGNRLCEELLHEVGLADVLADCRDVPDHVVVTAVAKGPGSEPGVCLYPKTQDNPPGWSYRREHQEWRECGSRWLGWERDQPPTPPCLVRRVVCGDYLVNDMLGEPWFVPCARSRDTSRSSLPVQYGFQWDGSLTRCVAPEFTGLWQLSGEVADFLRGRTSRDEVWQVEAALGVLRVNYRIGKPEVSVLQALGRAVLTKATVRAILMALIDADLEQEFLELEHQKKTATSPGDPVPG